jgi:archaellum component FlaC
MLKTANLISMLIACVVFCASLVLPSFTATGQRQSNNERSEREYDALRLAPRMDNAEAAMIDVKVQLGKLDERSANIKESLEEIKSYIKWLSATVGTLVANGVINMIMKGKSKRQENSTE